MSEKIEVVMEPELPKAHTHEVRLGNPNGQTVAVAYNYRDALWLKYALEDRTRMPYVIVQVGRTEG